MSTATPVREPGAAAGSVAGSAVGQLLRSWREHRRLSQLALADEAEVSTRHLSCVETGRARPSRGFLLHLSEHLDLPLRARNELLVAGGYAPLYGQTDLDAPEMAQVRQALDLALARAEPYPALVVDRRWDLVRANAGLGLLLHGVAPALLTPPLNVLRVSLHPAGLQPHLEEFGRYSAHVLAVLRRQAAVLGDPGLVELHDELASLPGVETSGPHESAGVVLPVRLRTPVGLLSFFTTAARFGTAADVTVAELTVESFFPADSSTAAAVEQLSRSGEQ